MAEHVLTALLHALCIEAFCIIPMICGVCGLPWPAALPALLLIIPVCYAIHDLFTDLDREIWAMWTMEYGLKDRSNA